MAEQTLEQTYEEKGYDVSDRGGSLIVDTPNPRVQDDDYFHGDNPHEEGFGSRGLAHEGSWADQDPTVGEGESTADVQQRAGGGNWGAHTGSTASDEPEAAPAANEPGGPDESWRNADLQRYADDHDIDTSGATTKAELLEAIHGE